MLFKLKDFQAKAVKTLLENIEAAIDLYHLRKKPITTSLTATTGAGKTVMSAAVIESLFFRFRNVGRPAARKRQRAMGHGQP